MKRIASWIGAAALAAVVLNHIFSTGGFLLRLVERW
jgi:hypothetical protein